jgi:hypothetical protein
MNGKLPYQSPTLTKWGSITDLTQGQGKSSATDSFTSIHKDVEFVGSNDNPVMKV